MQIDAKCLHYRHVLGLMSEFVIYDDTYDLRKHHRMSDKQLQREQVRRFSALANFLAPGVVPRPRHKQKAGRALPFAKKLGD